MIEFYVFYQLRRHGLSTKKILDVHQHMAKQLNTLYPFASYKFLYDKKRILYMADVDTLVKADRSNQIVIRQIIETFCKKIDFDDNELRDFGP